MDLLHSVAPDVQGSFTKMPFRSATFDRIYCDPPHLIRNDVKNWNPAYVRFGNYKNRDVFEETWLALGDELRRVLRPGGIVTFKYIYGKDRRVPKREDTALLGMWEISRDEWPSKFKWSTNTTAVVELRA